MVLSCDKSDLLLGEPLLFVYSLPDFKLLGSTGRRGKGPNEIPVFAMFCESEDESLYVYGYTFKTIRKFDINKGGELILDKIIDLPY